MDSQGDKREPENLEERVVELERIADALGEVSDEDLVERLEEAVGLLKEINAGIEAGLDEATTETRELGTLLDGVSFGPFDEALETLEKREREPDGP